jgi:Ca-activated chloride channel homolog
LNHLRRKKENPVDSKKVIIALLMIFQGILIPTSTTMAQDSWPTMVASVGEKKLAMVMGGLEVKVKIIGPVAENRITMVFYNPHDRQLAGELTFPLPEGATVSGYALDIDGQMVDGVVVEKNKGRQVFETLVRQGIDPGLVEHVSGTFFRTCVFPIPSQGSRTVMIRYVTELAWKGNSTIFEFPMTTKEKVKNFSLKLDVLDCLIRPKVVKSSLPDLRFERGKDRYSTEFRLENLSLTEGFVVEVPLSDSRTVQVERSSDGIDYFLIADNPPGSPPPPKRRDEFQPKAMTLVWDASGSREKGNHTLEISLVESLVHQWKQTLEAIDLIVLRNEAEKARRFKVTQGSCPELSTVLGQIPYDGATRLDGVAILTSDLKSDLILLVSDGLITLGKEPERKFSAPLTIVSADASPSHLFLQNLARENGGEFFHLTSWDTLDRILPLIGRPRFGIIGIQAEGGDITDLTPKPPFPARNRFIVTGRFTGESDKRSKVIVLFGINGRETARRSYEIPRDEARSGDLLRTVWAREKSDLFLALPGSHESELTDFLKKYGLLTPGTSLIVLDNLDQYIQFTITPPESPPDKRQIYFTVMENQDLPGEASPAGETKF